MQSGRIIRPDLWFMHHAARPDHWSGSVSEGRTLHDTGQICSPGFTITRIFLLQASQRIMHATALIVQVSTAVHQIDHTPAERNRISAMGRKIRQSISMSYPYHFLIYPHILPETIVRIPVRMYNIFRYY